MRARAWLLLACLGASVLATSSAQDARQTQRQLDQIKRELREVGDERRRLEGERGQATVQMRQVDEQVGNSTRALARTNARIAEQQQQLEELQQRRQHLTANMGQMREELQRLLRTAYSVGEDAPIKALLSQDRSAEARRLLTYHGYVQRQRAQRITELREQIASLDSLGDEIASTRQQLDRERSAQQAQVAQLEQDRKARAEAIAKLDSQHADSAARERALGSDARALEQVLAQLRAAAQRAEAARRAEAQRAARLARQQQQRQQQQRQAQQPRQRQPSAQASRSTAARASPVRAPAAAAATGPRVGGLGWPVAGQLLAGFGATMPDGRRSSGLLIAAPAGTRVSAVADGRVVFAEWMTGYGLIAIVDHGGGTLSLYAHNDALLQNVGTQVKRGDAISSVGTSGGQGRAALYFELRRNGQAVNPQGFLTRGR